jgi:hypothetical protein
MAALIALAAGGVGAACIADIKTRNKAYSEREQARAEKKKTTNAEKTNLERMVADSQVWTFNQKEISGELRDNRLPRPTKFYFIDNRKDRNPNEQVYFAFQNQFLLPLLNDLESSIGNRGLTGSEMLQLMSFYIDKWDFGADRFYITGDEVVNVIEKYQKEGKEGFKIRLEKMLQPEQPPMIANAPKKDDRLEAVKEQERRAYEGFKAGQKYAEGFKRGHEQYTREQLDAFSRSREAYIQAELNSRLWRGCPQYRR